MPIALLPVKISKTGKCWLQYSFFRILVKGKIPLADLLIAGAVFLGYDVDQEHDFATLSDYYPLSGRDPFLRSIAIPKEAATVILMRPTGDADRGPFEVLMVHRHPDSIFVPECYVFPGGCIDAGDCAPELVPYCCGRDAETAWHILGDMPDAAMSLGAWIAAVRETFEETGILLARPPFSIDRLTKLRRLLLNGEKTFTELVREEKWKLALERLKYFAHWITPEFLPYRYDVRFFVALAPEGQTACPDGIELTGHVWITPGQALDDYAADRFPMVLPTIMTLRELSAFPNIEAVLAGAAVKKVPAILTRVVPRESGLVEIMPDGTVFSPVR